VELLDNLALGLATAATWQNLLFCPLRSVCRRHRR
jgi:hypothetical protein